MKKMYVMIVLLALFPTLVAGAEKAPAPEPIEVTAQTMEAVQATGRVHFAGTVVAKQGVRTVYAQSLDLVFGGDEKARVLETVEASGEVRVVEGERIATADRMIYLQQEESMTLTGNAQVQQGDNRISGDEIVLFLRENRSLVKSGKDGRVRAVFLPQGGSR